jgi:cytochrome c-type protein NapB
MNKPIAMILVMSLAALAGCASMQFAAAPPQTMRGADAAAAEQAFEEKKYLGEKPGLQKPIERTFKEQPPLVPHAMANFDEITLEENQCLNCHSVERHKEKRAPKVGDNHLAAKGSTEISMSRYQCTTCHVPQADAKPLVDNDFVGNAQTSSR